MALKAERTESSMSNGLEVLLTSREASQVLKIHPKVLERMAKRGEVPALKVGKFWRYRASCFGRLIPTSSRALGKHGVLPARCSWSGGILFSHSKKVLEIGLD